MNVSDCIGDDPGREMMGHVTQTRHVGEPPPRQDSGQRPAVEHRVHDEVLITLDDTNGNLTPRVFRRASAQAFDHGESVLTIRLQLLAAGGEAERKPVPESVRSSSAAGTFPFAARAA